MSDKYHRVIGIDLGTTYSAVAVYNRYEEETEIIPNPDSIDNQGRAKGETTPSVISLDPVSQKAIVGWPAKRNVWDTKNTIIEIKREMGEVFREDTLDRFHARGQYQPRQIAADSRVVYEGDPVKVEFAGEWRLPQEISAFTLMKMKQVAEAHIGEPIVDAVITVPAYFTEKQKKATEEAAYLAGLYPRQLIPEPTAAAICYGVDRLESKRKVYLVYDLGGGTFDVSIISVEESQISVLATSGDPRLGGGDFDDAIVEWALRELKEKHQLDVGGDLEKQARIKAHAEQAKKELSTLSSTTLTLLDVWPQRPPALTLTRETFEQLIQPLLNKSLTYVDAALQQAFDNRGLRREDLDAILLVGGSTKIPRCKSLLLEHFAEDESFVSSGLNPDEVVARGAATVALKFVPSEGPFDPARRPDNSIVNPDLDDVMGISLITEHSLGIGVQNNLVSRIIDQGTNIPVSRRQGGFTNGGPCAYVNVPVYQGEDDYTFKNTLIGTLQIGPMEPKPEGTHQFEVTFSLDDNGLLAMTVHHINEGKNYQAQFEQKTGVGGPEALAARHAKLLRLYSDQPARMPQTVNMPPSQPVAPVPPTAPQVPGPAVAPAAAAATNGEPPAPPAFDPGASVEPAVAAQASGDAAAPWSSSGGNAATATAPPITEPQPQPVAPTAGAAPLQPTVEVPAEFRSIVRRAQKAVQAGGPAPLLEAYNQFIQLLNSGAPADRLEEAGDELADVYHDCR